MQHLFHQYELITLVYCIFILLIPNMLRGSSQACRQQSVSLFCRCKFLTLTNGKRVRLMGGESAALQHFLHIVSLQRASTRPVPAAKVTAR